MRPKGKQLQSNNRITRMRRSGNHISHWMIGRLCVSTAFVEMSQATHMSATCSRRLQCISMSPQRPGNTTIPTAYLWTSVLTSTVCKIYSRSACFIDSRSCVTSTYLGIFYFAKCLGCTAFPRFPLHNSGCLAWATIKIKEYSTLL
jgi:hypothetical protein